MPFISGKKYTWNLASFDDGLKMGEEWDRLHDNTDDLNTRATSLETRATDLETRATDLENGVRKGYDDTDTTADLAVTGLPDNGPWLVMVHAFSADGTGAIEIREGGVGGTVRGLVGLQNGNGYFTGMAIISGTDFYVDIGANHARRLVTWQRFANVV